ncbi:lytic transglycosylase domain-containing protein [Azoarcus sp. DN11]|uniref:lytic transglycosylase domain-containing protein n=1 Tax=Azoarcus sp. DN11 TaxID=356837 RepID=UPI000EB48780|nr:lytic transglycosylase domain-containing protein [Azoarcus sp. DN11]AYH41972.1 lytic transglycosylase [Azoarcus sp. DN11]
MKPPIPLLAAVWFALPLAAQADVYLKVEPDGTVTLTDEPRRGFERVVTAPAPRSGGSAPIGGTGLVHGEPSGEIGALPFAPQVAAAAAEHDLPEALIHAVIRVESNYDPRAVSPKGAVGLMQLMPRTARAMGVVDARNPAENIRGGARYLKRLLEMFGNDVGRAVAAYNAGPGAVVRSGGMPPFAETRRYVPRVIEHFERLGGRRAGRLS